VPLAGPADLLSDLAAAFASLHARWYVFGAQAALLWGRPRLTADVDVTIDPAGRPTAAILDILNQHGFTLRVEGTAEFIAVTRVLPLDHPRSGMALDLVLSGPGLEDVFHDRAIRVDVNGVAVPFISPEDLIVTKVLAGRQKDLEDIRGVLDERGASLDLDHVRTMLQAVERALGQSDLRPMLEAEVARWRARTDRDQS
jgi:hypothetical protein